MPRKSDDFSVLIGMTLTSVELCSYQGEDNELEFYTNDNRKFVLYHDQDCCEVVYIESVVGNLDDIIGSPILLAESVSSSERHDDGKITQEAESVTWTFYKISTIKGSVTIRWYGTSNGYYSKELS